MPDRQAARKKRISRGKERTNADGDDTAIRPAPEPATKRRISSSGVFPRSCAGLAHRAESERPAGNRESPWSSIRTNLCHPVKSPEEYPRARGRGALAIQTGQILYGVSPRAWARAIA